nr:hypothetical protein [Tanacetum cinerariifolium]
DVLSVESRAHVFRKKSLLAMGIITKLANGVCYWPVTRQVRKDDEVEEAANKGSGGSADMYWKMTQDDWQVRQGQ